MMRATAIVAALLAAGLAAATPPTAKLAGGRGLGPSSPSTRISFALTLKINERRLDRDLASGAAPAPSAAALGVRYGVPLAAERRVTRVLAANGIDVTATYPQRTEIAAVASAAALGRFFHVSFRDYLDASGRRYHAPLGTPTVPAALRPDVTGVVGLSTRAIASPADLPHQTLRPQDSTLAYDVTPLSEHGISGQGQTIAIVSLEPFPPSVSQTSSDIKTFRSHFGIDGPSPVDVKVDGGGQSKDETEDDLDIDVTSAIAPGAQIVNYEAPETASGLVDVFNRVLADGKAKIVAFSWGLCDSGLSASLREGVENVLRLADRRGVSIFVASGDSGAYDCQRDSFSDHALSVDFPSDTPQVISVGGTLLDVQSNGSYGYEIGWENPLTDGGGGGGTNTHDPAPSWQTAAHIGGGHRALPDVSASASPSSGWLVRDYGNWDSIGGTSAAAPFWAAAMLLAEQYAASQGVKKTCFLAPLLYRLALSSQPYPAFHDVTLGGNRHFSAGPGWDYATGLGSPDVWNLARDLAVYLRKNPCGPAS
jgi:subtilase family serine protease